MASRQDSSKSSITICLRVFFGVFLLLSILASICIVVVSPIFCVSGDFMFEFSWDLELDVFLIFPVSHPYLVILFV